MRRLIVNCMVVLMCCFSMISVAYGTEERADTTASPQIYRIKPQAPYEPRLLRDAFLVSDDEVAFYIRDSAQGGYLIQTDRIGNTRNIVWVKNYFSKDSDIVYCTKTDDCYFLGAINREEGKSELIAVSIRTGEVLRRFALDFTVLEMTSIPNGICVFGATSTESTVDLRMVQLNLDFDVLVDKIILSTEKGTDTSYVLPSPSAAAEEYFYIQLNQKAVGDWKADRYLCCFYIDGTLKWKTALPQDMYIRSISANHQNVFLFGSDNDTDEKGFWINTQATVLCYSYEGEQLWQNVYSETPQLYYSASNDNLSVGASGIDGGRTYLCVVDNHGNTQKFWEEEIGNSKDRGTFLTSDNHVLILCQNDTSLFIISYDLEEFLKE